MGRRFTIQRRLWKRGRFCQRSTSLYKRQGGMCTRRFPKNMHALLIQERSKGNPVTPIPPNSNENIGKPQTRLPLALVPPGRPSIINQLRPKSWSSCAASSAIFASASRRAARSPKISLRRISNASSLFRSISRLSGTSWPRRR